MINTIKKATVLVFIFIFALPLYAKKILRKKWKEWLGIDIFYPYFKAKEIEDWVKDKCSIKLFKMKGRPKFEKDRFTYTFKTKF